MIEKTQEQQYEAFQAERVLDQARESRKSNSGDDDMSHHKIVLRKPGEGMSFFANLQNQTKATPGAQKSTFDKGFSSDLLAGLLRRI